MIISYLLDELDKILALIGVLFSLALIVSIKLLLFNPLYEIVGIICFIICTGYLIIRRFFYPSMISSLEELKYNTRFYITLNILFFFLLSYSIITIYLSPEPYLRPLGYFISTALMAVLVANEVLFLSTQKSQIYFALCKIIIIGLSLVFSQTLIFPSIVGIDPWYHQGFTLKILDNGYIPIGFSYSKLPMTHLMIGMTSLITDLGYKMAAMISISFLQVVCDALFIFLLGKFLISTKVGLLAALLLEVANYHILFGYVASPNTAAATLILPIIFIIFKLRKDKPFIGTSIVMFLMGTLILTHTVTSMCMAILLFVFYLSFEVYMRLFNQEKVQPMTWTMCILFSTGMFAYWSYISGHILTLANFIKIGFYDALLLEHVYTYLSAIPFWEKASNNLAMFLFFSISLIGSFYMLSKQFRNKNRFACTIGCTLILCLAFFPLITGRKFIADRWIYFSQILVSVPLSLSLLLLNGMFKHKFIKSLLMSISVFFLSFILIINPYVNMDNRLFFPNSIFRAAFTNSELQAIDTISEICNGTIGGDWYIKRPYELQFNREFVDITDSLKSGDFTELQNIPIIVREEILNYKSYSLTGGFNINYELHIALYNQSFSRIYNCGSASGYLKP